MQKKDFLYFLTDKDGRCYKLDHRGKVVLDNQILPLPLTPDGWEDYAIKYSRDTTYFGTLRNLTIALQFVTDGRQIIQKLFYTGGIQAECYLRIAKLNVSTGVHERYYVGALDFSTFDDDKTAFSALVNILDNGLASLIKNKQATTMEIPIGPDDKDMIPDGLDPKLRVKLDGVNLLGHYLYTSLTGTDYQTGWSWLDAVYVSVEGHFKGVTHQNVTRAGITGITDPINDPPGAIQNSDKWIVAVDQATTFTITLDYSIDIGMASPATPGISTAKVWLGTSSQYAQTSITDNMPAISLIEKTNYSGSTTRTVTLAAGEKLYLYMAVNQSPILTGMVTANIQQFDLKISGVTREIPSFCYANRLSFVYERLIHKISGLYNNAKSDLLADNDKDSARYTVLITNGNAIRRLNVPVIKTTFQDFFKAMNCLFNVGFGVENEVGVLEKKTYFYDKDAILTALDDVSNLKVNVATDDFYNLVQIGYQPQTYDDVNGKDEFNATSEFGTPITRISNTLDLVSPYRADMYGIEFARINFDGQDTTDGTDDETIFLLVCNAKPETDDDGEYYTLYRDPTAVVSGLIAGNTAFNIEISPKHLLRRHGNYIHAMLDKLDADSLTFQSADKNDGMSITYPANPLLIGSKPVTITENADIPIAFMDNKLYLPYIFEFDTEIPGGVKDLFDNNPRGLVSFTWKGETYKGYILDCSIKPAFKESQTWQLLAAADCDMTKLIDNG